MTIKQITDQIERIAPLKDAEDFDNVGLLVGSYSNTINKVLVSLDCTEEVVDEAIEVGAELIVCFHPIVFKGLKKFNGSNYVERVVIKAIKHDISIYAMHTALDNSPVGVNKRICDQLGILNPKILIPKSKDLLQLNLRVPVSHAELVIQALFKAGAGKLGNYDSCGFRIPGSGSFRPLDGADPFSGQINTLSEETEIELKVSLETHLKSEVLAAMIKTHPYEEVAYELILLENQNQYKGMGMIGELEEPVSEKVFLNHLKDRMKAAVVRHSALKSTNIQKVAVLGGSGVFALSAAIAQGADAFVSADFKYHDFFQAENRILICDIGHYESEQYTKDLLVEHLKKNFPNFAVILSSKNTNPIHYS
ncbi:MAG: Nif3-like dinuclear metal center hexameric protein [Flavobacteriaceae bacterium]